MSHSFYNDDLNSTLLIYYALENSFIFYVPHYVCNFCTSIYFNLIGWLFRRKLLVSEWPAESSTPLNPKQMEVLSCFLYFFSFVNHAVARAERATIITIIKTCISFFNQICITYNTLLGNIFVFFYCFSLGCLFEQDWIHIQYTQLSTKNQFGKCAVSLET